MKLFLAETFYIKKNSNIFIQLILTVLKESVVYIISFIKLLTIALKESVVYIITFIKLLTIALFYTFYP